MINYAPHPQEYYCINLPFKNKMMKELILGLGDRKHVNDPQLWNLLVITSKLPYLWEDQRVKKGDRPAQFSTIEEARSDLTNYIGDTLVGSLVRNLSPLEFLEVAKKNSLKHLKLCKYFGGDENGLRQIIAARSYTWAVANGRPIPVNGKVVIEMIRRIEL